MRWKQVCSKVFLSLLFLVKLLSLKAYRLSELIFFYILKVANIRCFIIWGRCNLKRSRRTVIFLPVYKTLQLKTLDFLQQTITMNENAQWQMIKDSVLFALSSGFSVSLFHFYLKKKSTKGVLFCISSFFSLHRSLYLLLVYCLYWRQLRSRELSFNLFPVGSHVVEHFEVH